MTAPAIKVILDTRYPRKDGTYPLRLRITYQKKRYYYKTGLSATREQWEKTKRTRLSPESKKVVRSIIFIEARAEEITTKQMTSFDSLLFRAFFEGTAGDVFQLYDEQIKRLIKEKRYGTADNYKYSMQSLQQIMNITKLPFSTVCPSWLRRYEKAMLEADKSITTIGIYLRPLRHIYTIAREKKYTTANAFQGYTIPRTKERKSALSTDQLNVLFNITVPQEYTSQAQALDMFIFSYLHNGMNPADMCRLKIADVRAGKFAIIRKKIKDRREIAAKPLVVRIKDQGREIVERYHAGGIYAFPWLKAQTSEKEARRLIKNLTKTWNQGLARICKREGIQKITMSYARHSAATALRNGGAPLEFISEWLGHSSTRTTQVYLASFPEDQAEGWEKLLNVK